MFPENTWYVAATPGEIDEKPLGRTICNERIVFYRGEENKVAAVEDFCPHRCRSATSAKASWSAVITAWRWAAAARP